MTESLLIRTIGDMAQGTTAEALVDAAEELFASEGFESASLRAVMRAAGSDPGAIHYHFGGRRELAAAVLDRVLAPLNARRLELLAELEAASPELGTIGLAPLLEAIVRPDIETAVALRSRGNGRARLIGAVYLNPAAFVTEQVEQHFGPVAQRFFPHLSAAIPHVPAEVISWRIRWSLFGMLGALLADENEPFLVEADELITRIVDVAVGAIAASPSAPPTPETIARSSTDHKHEER